MRDVVAKAACSQCGQVLPAEGAEVAGWKHAELVLAGELDEALLVCPECREEDRELAYDEGGAE